MPGTPITEATEFTAAVPRIETTMRALGAAPGSPTDDGDINAALAALAKRTRYLVATPGDNLAFDPFNRIAAVTGVTQAASAINGRNRFNGNPFTLVAAGADAANPYPTPALKMAYPTNASGRFFYPDEVGLAVGGTASFLTHVNVAAGTMKLGVYARSAAGAVLASQLSAATVAVGVQTVSIAGFVVPANTSYIEVRTERQTGTGDITVYAWGLWRGNVVRGFADSPRGDAAYNGALIADEQSRGTMAGPLAPVTGPRTVGGAIIAKAILSLQLYGTRDPTKDYVVEYVSRGPGTWRIIIDAWPKGTSAFPGAASRVCEFNTNVNPESATGISTHALTPDNNSGITGTVTIDWSQIGAGVAYTSTDFQRLSLSAWVLRNASDAATLGGMTAAQVVGLASSSSPFTPSSAGTNAAMMRALFLDVQLQGARVPGKSYGFEYVSRGPGTWRIILSSFDAGGANPARVAEVNTTANPEAAAGLPTVMTLTTLNNSGITGRVIVDWTQWTAAYSYSFLYHMVLDPARAWTRRLADPESGTPSVVLPRKIYTLLGGTGAPNAIEELNLYIRALVRGVLAGGRVADVVATKGRQYDGFWRLQPGNETISQYAGLVAGSQVAVGVNVEDGQFGLLASGSTTVEVVDRSAATAVRLLAIGDSITRDGTYAGQVAATLPNAVTRGIRTYDDGALNREGRGGWTLAQYVRTQAGTTNGDSPFLFPDSVAGASYRGNVDFWKKVCYTNSGDYDYDGFQKIARGWGAAGAPYEFGPTGYPSAPNAGDVVYDPALGAGARFQQWNGAAWAAMAVQPNWQLSFAKYMARFAAAYPDGDPTHVSLLLGANDFQLTAGISAGIGQWITDMQALVASIHAYSAAINVILCIPTIGAPQDAWGINLGAGQISEQYTRNMQDLGAAILTQWDTDAAIASKIYVAPLGTVVDPVYGFDTVAEAVSKYVATVVSRYNNWVHPNASGHKQMGDALAGVVQRFR